MITVLLAAIGGASGCAAEQEARFLSAEEAEGLAMARFRNFTEGTRELSIRTTAPDGSAIGLHGYFDYARGAGVAQLWTGAEEPEQMPTDLVWWSHAVVGELTSADPAPDTHAAVPVPEGDDEWEFFVLDASASPLMSMLSVAANLGFDRPDNPKLLEQSDALWLGTAPLPEAAPDAEGTWYQLPSADEVRDGDAQPAENILLPRILVDGEGTIWRAERSYGGPEAGESSSSIVYGETRDEPIEAPPVEPPGEEAD